PTARMFYDIHAPDGGPAPADARHVLKRTLAKAADAGFTFYVHPAIDFYLFKSGVVGADRPEPVISTAYSAHLICCTAKDFRPPSVQALEDMGIRVEFSHHEAGPGQNEIDLRYADALTMADHVMTFRALVKEIAVEQGVHATFMPKPLAGEPGNGMHTHVSL